MVEMTNGLLPGCDRDLVSVLKRRLDKKFAKISLSTKVVELKAQKDAVEVTLEDKKGGRTEQEFAKVLVWLVYAYFIIAVIILTLAFFLLLFTAEQLVSDVGEILAATTPENGGLYLHKLHHHGASPSRVVEYAR